MEETSSSLHMKPINNLSGEKNIKHGTSIPFLLSNRELLKRYIQTFKQVVCAMTQEKDKL